jgi:streptogramin lyase
MLLRLASLGSIALTFLCACASHTLQASSASLGGAAVPHVIQGGGSPWESFSANGITLRIITGPDNEMWYLDWVQLTQQAELYRMNVSSGQATQVPLSFNPDAITSGPDGNVWACGRGALARVTPGGSITNFAGPKGSCGSFISSGSVMWASETLTCNFVQVTTQGVITEYFPPMCLLGDLAVGSDGNVWYTQINRTYHYTTSQVVRFQPASQTYTTYLLPEREVLAGLKLGSDGSLYSCMGLRRKPSKLAKITVSGVITSRRMRVPCFAVSNTGPANSIYYVTNVGRGGIGRVALPGLSEKDFGAPPDGGGVIDIAYGPDLNLWTVSRAFPAVDVYITRVLTVTPSSATISVGSSTPFTISETQCQCVWTAVSANPSIASASSVSGAQFRVTGVSAGSTTITVSDQKQNVFDVAIQVQ